MSIMSESTLVLGWRCPLCTLMNSLTRCECAACATRQPSDAVLEEYFVSPDEYNEIKTEVQVDQVINEDERCNKL